MSKGSLRDLIRHGQGQCWRFEHADFISAYNALLESEGLPLAQWRNF